MTIIGSEKYKRNPHVIRKSADLVSGGRSCHYNDHPFKLHASYENLNVFSHLLVTL